MKSKIIAEIKKVQEEILRLESFDQSKADILREELFMILDVLIDDIIEANSVNFITDTSIISKAKMNLN